MPAIPKPASRTPEQRKADRQTRTHNVLKPAQVDKPKPQGPTQGKPKPERPPNALKTYRPEKPKKGLQRRSGLGVTAGTRTLQKRLQRLLVKRQGYKIKALTHRPGFTLKKGQGLKKIGVRGRRLLPGDRKQEAKSHVLPCVCGCNAHLQPGADGIPGKGLIARAHLESRKYEATRNEDFNNLPACAHLNHWLDQEATRHGDEDDTCKAVLLRLAKEIAERENGRRLTPEEVQPILSEHGFYTWLLSTTRI